ncbi:hypothetical protein M3P36_09200 [Altererythrobacter sp. KTW20L]|uniref:hypothetical protein n=1 Tax=Altererythrobacter sp. KTW20L TaxID=2942210 RepID=UPI0020BDE046|nr:hypothetical protein [Altererythrobacter sp. KTW20L]MCL6251214.1 hypothetical protein [Altererythrobacter sp. KTW20L]
MQLRKSASFQAYLLLTCLVLAAIVPTVALANGDPSASDALPEDGVIIYSRDVRHYIGDRYFLRDSQSAVTAPVHLIVNTIALGLEPLTDSESSAILAPLSAQSMIDPSFAVASEMPDASGGSANLIATTSSVSSTAISTISGAMQSLSGALESLSVLSGGGQ